jgi:polysaccharide export outer membrane protein
MILMRPSSLLRLGISFLLLAAGVSTAAEEPSPANAPNSTSSQNGAPVLQQRDPRYLINKTDVLQLSFTFTPEYDQSVTVGPDGYISPKGVADVHVEGLSAPEVSAALQKAYSKILHEPLISVIPTTVVPAYFIAGGEVGKPGKYTLQGNTTVTQAIQIAGGFTENAKHSQLVLFRRINADWVQGTKINVKEMLKSGNLAEDLNLQSGDMLYAPKNTISKVETWTLPWSQFMKLNFITKPIY